MEAAMTQDYDTGRAHLGQRRIPGYKRRPCGEDGNDVPLPAPRVSQAELSQQQPQQQQPQRQQQVGLCTMQESNVAADSSPLDLTECCGGFGSRNSGTRMFPRYNQRPFDCLERATSGASTQVMLCGLPTRLMQSTIRTGINLVLQECPLPVFKHLICVKIRHSEGTCLFRFDNYAWSAIAIHYLSAGGGLDNLRTVLGATHFHISYNMPDRRLTEEDTASRRLRELTLRPIPPSVTEWDLFSRLVFEPSCGLVPTLVRKTTDGWGATALFARREHVLYFVCRLRRTPLICDSWIVCVQWIPMQEEVPAPPDGEIIDASEACGHEEMFYRRQLATRL